MGKKPSLLYPTSRGFSLAWLLAGYLCFWLNDKKNLAWFYYTDKGNWNTLGSSASSKFYKNILLNIMSLIIKRAVNGCSALLFQHHHPLQTWRYGLFSLGWMFFERACKHPYIQVTRYMYMKVIKSELNYQEVLYALFSWLSFLW